jgi:hypothetical protein
MKLSQLLSSLTTTVAVGYAQVLNPLHTSTQYSAGTTEPLDITSFLDNRGFGTSPGDADFDGSQSMETATD